jgi:thiol-disulfide isomerase/thioredoxin
MTFARLAALIALAAAPFAHAGEIQPYSAARFTQLTAAGKPVLLDVRASWCPTCRAQAPIIDALMARPEYRDVTTLTIDFDADKPLLKQYQVVAQSTLVAYKGAKEVGRSVGDTTPAGIEGLLKKAAN